MLIFRLNLFSLLVYGCFGFESEHMSLLQNGYLEYQKTGVKPQSLTMAFRYIQLPNLLKHDRFDRDDDNNVDNDFCLICKTFANFLMELVRAGATRDQLVNQVTDSCVNFGVGTNRVCKGIANLNVDIFIDIVQKHPELTGKNLCGIRYSSDDCDLSNKTLVDWSVDIPKGDPAERPKPSSPKEGFKILHISDIHYDTFYRPNKTLACQEPLCCQYGQADGNSANGTTCGFWGDYGLDGVGEADSPSYLLPEVLKDVKTRAFDYVYFTGDIVSHRTWETSVSFNSKVLKDVYGQFKQTFNVPVYPVVGNHEPTPANVYYFANGTESKTFSTKWLYELAIEQWADWLPPNTFETILKGGFYTVSPKKGFRVVVLNNNIAHNANWWLVDSTYDPYEQLAWLVQVLHNAEKNKESVHILSHFPSGKGLLKVWSKEYNKIVQRYYNTITAQFNGHTHYDQFVVYYKKKEDDIDTDDDKLDFKNKSKMNLDKKDKYKPINVAFNGASITTYGGVNPSYKIYSVENTSFDILNFEEYTFNLTQANIANHSSENPLEWYKLYSFTDAYNVDKLSAKELDSLLYRMCKNHSLLDTYHKFRYRNADPALHEGCDDNCKKDYLCELTKYQKGKKDQCEFFQDLYDKNVLKKVSTDGLHLRSNFKGF